MSMIDDEALAIYSAAKEQQAAIAHAIDAMNKASRDITGRYAEFVAALDQVRNLPKEAINPLKRAVAASVEAGIDEHLKPKTKALGEAVDEAMVRIDAIKDRGVLALAAAGFLGAMVGGLCLFAAQVLMTPAPVATAPQFPLPIAGVAPAKKRH